MDELERTAFQDWGAYSHPEEDFYESQNSNIINGGTEMLTAEQFKTIDLAQLKANCPNLVEALESEISIKVKDALKVDEEVNSLKTKVETLEAANSELKSENEKLVKEKAEIEAANKVAAKKNFISEKVEVLKIPKIAITPKVEEVLIDMEEDAIAEFLESLAKTVKDKVSVDNPAQKGEDTNANKDKPDEKQVKEAFIAGMNAN